MIVVGVDGSASAVRLVGVWHVPVAAHGGAFVPPAEALEGELEPQMRQALERALDETDGSAGDVEVEMVVREGAPAATLLEEAQDAVLLVLGTRGLGGFRGLLLGSVASSAPITPLARS
jgi:nucleotide-binding universal stress UspA family protein